MKIKFALMIMTSKALVVVKDTKKCVKVLKGMASVSLSMVVHTNTKSIKTLRW